jgi:hypothetical protein
MTRAEEEARVSNREKMLLILTVGFIGIGFDYLFYGKILGVSYPLFIALLLGYFLITARDYLKLRNITSWFLLLVIVLISLTFALHDNTVLKVLNFMGVPVIIVAYTLLVTNKSLLKAHPVIIMAAMLERVFALAVACSVKFFRFSSQILSARVEGKSSLKKQILVGLAISLPILLIIIPLLASADMIFAHYLRNITDFFPDNVFSRLILIGFITLYVFGYAWSFKYAPREESPAQPSKPGKVDPVIPVTVLSVVNLVYLLFTTIQSNYLYGGASRVLPPGLSYAEYARRGFFELVAVTVINFLVLLVIHKIIDQRQKSTQAEKALLSILVAFTINMLFAAHYKMALYEQAYGYTELRIYVQVFMLFMAIVFALALLRIWTKKIPLLKAVFISALLFYLGLNYLNVHGLVAEYNYQRYLTTGKIDAYYLTQLGYEATPVLIKLASHPDRQVVDTVTADLLRREEQMGQHNTWMEYNLSAARARKLIQGTK